MVVPEKFSPICNEILLINAEILNLNGRIQYLSEQIKEFTGNPHENVLRDSNNIIIQIYRGQIRHAVRRLNLLT